MSSLSDTDFSQTYLHKLHVLTNSLDKLFDQTLRMHDCPGLSQLMLMLVVARERPMTASVVAQRLDISKAAISRQIEVALKDARIQTESVPGDRRTQLLLLTKRGVQSVENSIKVLEEHVFKIFDQEDTQTSLMNHIDMLTENTKEVLREQVLKKAAQTTHNKRKEIIMSDNVPKARRLYRGDINDAVIRVQKATGIEITKSWWDSNVGNNGTSEQILDRFDKAYAVEFEKRKPKSS